MIQLRNALNAIEPIRKICIDSDLPVLRALGEQLNPCNAVSKRISKEIVENAPVALNRGSVICPGVNAELDNLREIAFKGKDYLLGVQQREINATGIPALKIG